MKEIRLTRYYLANPLKSLTILLGLVLVREILTWSVAPTVKMSRVNEMGGFLEYLWIYLIRGLLLPEVCTLIILLVLLNQYHLLFKVKSVGLDWRSISRYELRILPVILLAFFIYNPITQTVRFFLETFPHYSFQQYWSVYIAGAFTWRIFLAYSVPMMLIGYIAVNLSLLSDYLKQRQDAQEEAERAAVAAVMEAELARAKATALEAQNTSNQSLSAQLYLTHLKGKNNYGELDFPVTDVYFFTIEDRYYYAELVKGRYLVGKTLNELEAELNPNLFFRIKRDYIVNRNAVLNYAYWENGKYIVRLNTSGRHEIVVPRARMQEFREWLQGIQRSDVDSNSGSLVLTSEN